MEDQARAETVVPLDADALFNFVSNIERLFRLHPHLEIETWQATPAGFHLSGLNETNERRVATGARVDIDGTLRRIVISYDSGLKLTTRITVETEAASGGARLIVVDHYPLIADTQDPRVAEVDRGLIAWVAAIRRHLMQRARWGRLPGWRWWNERFMPGLPPRQRRIVRLLIWTTVAEFVLFLGLVAILVVTL